ncbi:MAG TPA: hypothetical protein PLU88_06125 [Armatimonadota bacterium]|nr:hypothetical protein [Armatimonadota bacterium]
MYRLLFVALLIALYALMAVPAAAEDNPHDGYMFWLPCGELKLGDAASMKEFNYTYDENGGSFTVPLRQTRFDVPAGQLVIVRNASIQKIVTSVLNTGIKFTVDGQPAGQLGDVTFVPRSLTNGKKQVKIEFETNPFVIVESYRFYYTDDADKLGIQIEGSLEDGAIRPSDLGTGYLYLLHPVNPSYSYAKAIFEKHAKAAATPEAARHLRRLVRWCDAGMQFKNIRTGAGYYNLGLYSMVNGFWDLAYDCFTKATELLPNNPDAWYMLGDASSYKYSDLSMKMEKSYPYYRKAADLYRSDNSNTYRTFFGFFKKLRVKDGDKEIVLNMTDEQIEYSKKMWEWCTALMESASRGALRLETTYNVYEEEFDSTNEWNHKPYEGLFNRGEVETFVKMTGWGASACCGHDCGPNRSAFMNMGIREWDVYLHEWNHSLDWAMISGELGIGVPTTHSSDWCGFEPISSMGMGHHSLNRYYMTPGMYRYVRGSDPITTPYITDWLVAKPVELVPAVSEEQIMDERFFNEWTTQTRKKATQVTLPRRSEFTTKVVADDGYIDLEATFSDLNELPQNIYTFAKTYVYSPKRQKVRMWLGADDNIRMWQNGRLIHKGTTYWSCALFTECREKDQVVKGVMLEEGWNEFVVQITSIQRAPDWLGGNPPDQWGFSVRICDMYNREVPGLRYLSQVVGLDYFSDVISYKSNLNPKSPKTYSWEKVAHDYTMLIPQLTIDDLRAITGYKTMTATNEVFFDLSKENIDPAIKPYVIDKADPKVVALDNQLNWFFSPKEFAAVVRYKRGSQTRDLLFLRPEAYESYLKLIQVTPEAKKLGINRHIDQVIGYFLTEREESPNGRIVLVVDTYLGNKLPVDEEDLLNITNLK